VASVCTGAFTLRGAGMFGGVRKEGKKNPCSRWRTHLLPLRQLMTSAGITRGEEEGEGGRLPSSPWLTITIRGLRLLSPRVVFPKERERKGKERGKKKVRAFRRSTFTTPARVLERLRARYSKEVEEKGKKGRRRTIDQSRNSILGHANSYSMASACRTASRANETKENKGGRGKGGGGKKKGRSHM